MAKRNRRFLALVLTLVLAFSLMSAAMAAGGTAQWGGKIEKTDESTKSFTIPGGAIDNFVILIKQAQGASVWTAQPTTADVQTSISNLFKSNDPSLDKDTFEFHQFAGSGDWFKVFDSTDSKYSTMAKISEVDGVLTVEINSADKISHLDYGTYGESTPPVTPPTTPTTYSLTVTKDVSVTLDGEPQSIPSDYSVTFNVYASTGTGYSTTSLGSATINSFTDGSGSATINGLENGDYVVAETVTGAPAGYTKSETGTTNVRISGENQTVAFTNSYSKTTPTTPPTTPPTTGNLTVTKNITGLPTLTSNYTVDVTVSDTVNDTVNDTTKTLTIAAGATSGSVTFDSLAAGSYHVTEGNVAGVPAGYEAYASESMVTADATVISGNTATATLTNAYMVTPPPVPTPFSLTVTKAVSVTLDNVAQSIPSDYSVTFNVYASTDTTHSTSLGSATISSFTAGSGSATISHLGNGNYVVVETTTGAPVGYTKSETGTANVHISGANQTASFTNSYSKTTATPPTTPLTGNLTVTKTIKGLPTLTSNYTVDVTVDNNVTKTLTIEAGTTSGSVTFEGIAAGSYAVTEANVTGVPSGYEADAGASTVTAAATVTAGTTVTASLINAYKVTTPGTVIIPPTTPTTDITDPQVPTTEVPTAEDPVAEITDPETPLADAAAQVTGDSIVLWIALACMSAVALVYIILIDKKHRNDTNR